MTARRRVKSLDDIWPDLEAGLTQLFTNLNEGFPRERWMQLYTYGPILADCVGLD